MTGIEAIAAERQRQIEEEGWTPEHDDKHGEAVLARAAACYAVYGSRITTVRPPTWWPFNAIWWKPKNRRADLVRAGALIAAEIDRLDRLSKAGDTDQ